MATVSADQLLAPFLTKMLGTVHVLSTDLRCTKQKNGEYVYDYSIEVHPEEEDENLLALLRQESNSIVKEKREGTYTITSSSCGSENQQMGNLSYKLSYHSDVNCVYLVNVPFILFHRNINGRGQSLTRAEFPSDTNLKNVIEYFRAETVANHRGNFLPRLAYAIGRERNITYPISDSDLQLSLSDLIGDGTNEANSLTIFADIS